MKKVLVVSAIACVTGIVMASAAGCGATEASTSAPDASQDVRSERRATEAGSEEDAGMCPLDRPLSAADFLAEPGYKPGRIRVGACSAKELTQFENNLDDVDIKTWKDLGKDLGDACAACIITSTADESWGPIVYTEESGGDRGFYNFGACFGVVEGSDLCGQSVQFLELCLDSACDSCAQTQAERDRCLDKAGDIGGMCEEFGETLRKDCKQIAASGAKCNHVADAARTLCGPAIADGGADASDAADAAEDADANDQ